MIIRVKSRCHMNRLDDGHCRGEMAEKFVVEAEHELWERRLTGRDSIARNIAAQTPSRVKVPFRSLQDIKVQGADQKSRCHRLPSGFLLQDGLSSRLGLGSLCFISSADGLCSFIKDWQGHGSDNAGLLLLIR